MADAHGAAPAVPVFCLSEVEIFADLDADEMAGIAGRAGMRQVPLGTVVWSPRERGQVLWIVKSGQVRLQRTGADGRRLTLAVLGPGSVFGQMPLLGQDMATSTAEALEDTVLCEMSETDVRQLLLSDPRIAARITEGLGRRLAELERRLADAVLKSAPQRVASTLLLLSEGAPMSSRLVGPRSPEIRLTHAQLADLVGTTRETTTKVLGELQAAGLVTLRRGTVRIDDRAGLRAHAEEPT